MNKLYSLILLFGLSALSASADDNGNRADIAPILSCQWGQDAPYSDLCPSKYPTGCTATAASQIMYYYKYPAQGTGSITYTSGTSTLSADFSKSTYDWESMLDKVQTSSPSAAKSAVALLMKDVGYGCKMSYARSESTAYLYDAGYALGTYFSYDKGIHHVLRKMYTDAEWESIIYAELEAGRPVIYCGYSKTNGWHTFVCDGYKNGKYHINFGWDGQYNAYYTLDDLFSYNQNNEALIGIQPDKGTAKFPTDLYNFDNFTTEKTTYKKGDNAKFVGQFVNRSLVTKTFRYGVEMVKVSDGTSTFVESTKDNERAPLSYYSNYQVQVNSLMAKTGTYTIYPAYRDEDNVWHRMHTDQSCVGYVTAKVTFSNITFTPGTVAIDDVIASDTPSHPQGIFSLDGRRLDRAPEKGMYIENGIKKMK